MTQSSVGHGSIEAVEIENRHERAFRKSSEGIMTRKSHMLPPTHPGRASHRNYEESERAVALYNPPGSKLSGTYRGTSQD